MKVNRATLLISLTLAGVAIVGLATKILTGGPPFRMAFRAVAGGTVVRFVQPGRALVSPDFPVSIPVPTPPEVVLDGTALTIPACQLDLADTTLLPGRIRVQIGTTLFDVMERGVVVAGKECDWKPQ